jgi:hypothetical protein
MRPIRVALTLLATAVMGDATGRGASDSLGPARRVWITGGSTIRRFTCRARSVSGSMRSAGRSSILIPR